MSKPSSGASNAIFKTLSGCAGDFAEIPSAETIASARTVILKITDFKFIPIFVGLSH